MVLAAATPFFERQLGKSRRKVIDITGHSGAVIEAAITFCYTGRILITNANLRAIVNAALAFELPELDRVCSDYMFGRRIPPNLAAYDFIARHFDLVWRESAYQQLGIAGVQLLLTHDDLFVYGEEDTVSAIIVWIRADEVERKRHFPQLMRCVRAEHLEPQVSYKQMTTDKYRNGDIVA